MTKTLTTINDFLLASELEILKHFDPEYNGKKPYIFRQGATRPDICLVAHADTLPRKQDMQLKEVNNIITVKGGGILGADDRAGCYALHKLQHLGTSLLITTGEETGGIGAKHASRDLDAELSGCKLMIELDRAGVNDYVFYSYDLHPKIAEIFEANGYFNQYGSYSDISEFPHIPAVNVSCGYYKQHTHHEKLHVDELYLNITRIAHIIQTTKLKKLYTISPRDRWTSKGVHCCELCQETKAVKYRQRYGLNLCEECNDWEVLCS